MNIQIKQVIAVSEWDALVKQTYGRPYSFQQQGGCRNRGTFEFSVPLEVTDHFSRTSVPEVVNHKEMGVSFAAWLGRDPNAPLAGEIGHGGKTRSDPWAIERWWERNFYPDIQMVANDLHTKGLLPAGTYTLDIDWC